jgi:hypothetical protein
MFNIREFKSRLNRHGGPALNSLFVAEFARGAKLRTRVPSNINEDDLRFFCQTVTVPGINLEVAQYRPTGVGFPEFMPMSSNPDTLNCVFMLDTNHNIITFFHQWINAVINVGGNIGRSGDFRTDAREINYKDEYTARLTIKHFSTFQETGQAGGLYEYVFDGVYPTQVGGITLSWADSSVSTASINFTYSRITHSGFRSVSAEESRFVTGAQDSISLGGRVPQNVINERILPPLTINVE